MNRIELLLGFLKDEPNDPFNYYALAIEYQNTNGKKANEYFSYLFHKFPNYLPTYYTAAKFYEENLEDYQLAIDMYQKGMDLAMKQKEIKAFNELQSAKTNLEFEID